jgi:uncharacterized caspase-like protein
MLCWPVRQCLASDKHPSRRRAGVFLACVVALIGLLVHATPTLAEGPRVALVIGNGNYDNEIGRLRNPTNDANLIARSLGQLGFKVILKTDIDQNEMKRAIRDFGEALRNAGPEATGLFYYAGHGVQVDGTNYLLPIGAHIEAEADVEIDAISADTVLKQMQFAENKVNLVFLDACRNNPLTRGFRSSSRGLARVDAPRGSFIGYSTAPGDVSVDGDSKNSPYTAALAEELLRPGAAIEEVHRAVRLKVLQATDNRQTPWDSSSLTASVVLASQAPVAVAAAPAPAAATADPAAEQSLWKSIETSNNPAVFEAYLRQFPNGIYAAHAAVRLEALRGGQSNTAAAAAQAPVTAAPVVAAAAAPPAPADAETTRAMTSTRYVAVKNANIRAKPNADARVIGKLKSGETIMVIGENADGSWLQVASATGDGFVSAPLLEARPEPVVPVAAPVAPPPPPAPKANALLLSSELRPEIERFLANSETIKGNYRFLAVNGAGTRLGTSTNCKIKKSGWGGYSAEGGCTEESSRRAAISACRDGDCRIIYNSTEKVGDFEIEWVGAGATDMVAAAPQPEPEPEPAPQPEPVAAAPVVTASAAAPTSSVLGDGDVLRLSSSLQADVERFLANSETIKGNYRFLAVNGAGTKLGTSTNCKIKKSGWGGYSAEGGCTEESSRRAAISACGEGDCRVIFNGTEKVGKFEIEWQ